MSTFEKVMSRLVVEDDGCWTWPGAQGAGGYGQLVTDGNQEGVHRIMWQGTVGSVPEGYHVHHTCHNKLCANPLHLACVSEADHKREHLGETLHTEVSRRKANSAKRANTDARELCRHGHSTAEFGVRRGPKQRWSCRECERDRNRAYKARKRSR